MDPASDLLTWVRAESRMNALQISSMLEKHNLNDFDNLNAFVFKQLNEKSTVDYSYFDECDLHDTFDESITANTDSTDETMQTNLEDAINCGDCYDSNDYRLVASKDTYQGMRIFDQIDPSKKSHYFQVKISDKIKFMHKQTAARLLITTKSCLSSDRLSRIQKADIQN
ncbi:unnamed protein product [Adineta ricciae]|uniref:Uncharacterized protein n=1 Tax=Adineta ricciae TaxID=249248 RepID=A0A815VKW5_ADIRI|nr:unnamed protein product [Adineta ricciae]